MIFRACILCVLALIACGGSAFGQVTPASQQAETLRAQLREVEAKEAELQARLRQLDEDLRPENIERSITLVGTTRPEELRDARRRQLENERRGVQEQLDQLEAGRTRLERAIAAADAEAYRQGAQVAPASQPAATLTVANQASVRRKRITRARRVRRRRHSHRLSVVE